MPRRFKLTTALEQTSKTNSRLLLAGAVCPSVVINGLLQLLQFPGVSRKSLCVHLVLVVLQHSTLLHVRGLVTQRRSRISTIELITMYKNVRMHVQNVRMHGVPVYTVRTGLKKLSSNSNFESSFVRSLNIQTNVRTFVRSFHP